MLKAKPLCGDGDILDQYITFTKVLDEQIRKSGRTRESVAETIRICKDRAVLKTYLKSREKEVIGIMMTLFDQVYLTGVYVKEQRKRRGKKVLKMELQWFFRLHRGTTPSECTNRAARQTALPKCLA